MVNLLEGYVDGWRRHDVPAVLATLAEDCVVIECYGPVYRGRRMVHRWMTTWLAAGGAVIDWKVTSSQTCHHLLIAEWTFTCVWQDIRSSFDGATIARQHEGEITHLREYSTTASLYEWTGAWRE